ncbi:MULTISPECIES: FtsK/SpoIIIE family DNA translocase [Methylosinus]|uniref:DNA translocase FtsK n=1 Tax=Methylosinus trichosporium (strain ATCC 35070 / NCIMB 11131 / UNIQEM 75 / OB3b) TaxID=595536 RepID=A0A2D2CX47_METT3|nr:MULTISPECIES: DNA translocase FtsK [Methylosinus]ATQ67239.1 DNA translocase FtsK [Methylosinus trichosporium OB3b]OBS52559.1 cell division protein FtsK [Methylosinus sp. 3S-1]
MPRSNALRRVPEPVREFVARRSAELAGAALLAGSLAAALALVSWSARDPSLNHATSGKVRNLLGSGGAIVADISMQMLGVATIAAILPLALLGARLLTQRMVHRPLLRIGLWIVGAGAAAAVASFLPVTDRWPLPTGLGGVLGDAILSLPRRIAGESTAIMALVAALACGLAIIALTGAAGFGFESRPEVAADDLEPERESDEDADEEPGVALVSLGALIHVALTVRTQVSMRLARLFARRPADALDIPAGPPLLGARREPVFDTFSFAPAAFTPAPPAPSRTRAAPAAAPVAYEEEDVPPPASARVMEPAGPLKLGKRVLRERQPSLFEGKGAAHYELPGLLLLSEPKKPAVGAKVSQDALEQNARLLEGVLEDFGVKGEIINVRPGPVVTLYELEPAPGIKSSRVIGLADDIARSMSAVSARVAVVSGRNAIGIELPNHRRETVFLRELLACEDFEKTKHRLAIALGKTIGGEPVIVDLARMPHLLVAGTTGSGKSVAINTMILSLLYRMRPEECRLIMVDPKMLELSVYDNIPHLLTPVVTDPKKAVVALKWAVREMEDRYKKMSKLGVRNIEGFNQRVVEAQAKGEVITRTVQTGFDKETGEAVFEHEEMDLHPLPFIVVIVDEMADLMLVAGKDIEGAIQRLAQMARAAGIHLIMATQRPSVDVITGTIKANFPTRISFQVTSKIDSRTILGEMGAEQLLGQGDMLYMAGGGRISRVHGPFVSDAEVEKIVAHLKTQGQPQYLDSITTEDEMAEEAVEAAAPGSMDAEESGDLYDRAVAIVLRDRKCSTSYIQRRLSIGYNKAASLVEQMEREGVVGQANHAGKREILVGGGIDRGAFDIEAAE